MTAKPARDGAASGDVFEQRLSDRDFARICKLIEQTVGIHLPDHKRSMVDLRVAKRVRTLGMSSLTDYCALVFDDVAGHVEKMRLTDAITTNKTDFFREADHFGRLVGTVIPDLHKRYPQTGTESRPLRVWSAGCSTGEEPYSIAMVLASYADRHPGFAFQVHASDVCSDALQGAIRAVYPEEHVCAVPVELRRRSLLRNKDHSVALVRVAPEIRSRVTFHHHNLLAQIPPVEGPFDIVFCRNVIIYFERDNQIRVLTTISNALVPGGYLFVGHSETLHGMSLPLQHSGPTLYQKVGR